MSSILKKSLILFFGSCTSLFAYHTLRVFLKRRRYRHIPGAPANGIGGFYRGHIKDVIEATKRGETIWDLLLE